jgi:hypothetical protein
MRALRCKRRAGARPLRRLPRRHAMEPPCLPSLRASAAGGTSGRDALWRLPSASAAVCVLPYRIPVRGSPSQPGGRGKVPEPLERGTRPRRMPALVAPGAGGPATGADHSGAAASASPAAAGIQPVLGAGTAPGACPRGSGGYGKLRPHAGDGSPGWTGEGSSAAEYPGCLSDHSAAECETRGRARRRGHHGVDRFRADESPQESGGGTGRCLGGSAD